MFNDRRLTGLKSTVLSSMLTILILIAPMGVASLAYADTRAARNGQLDAPTIVKRVLPAVVNISATRIVKGSGPGIFGPNSPFGNGNGDKRKRRESSLGSGVIVDPRGYIITNYHVIAKADEIKVVLADKREFKGKVIGVDPKTDLAVIKISARNLPVVPWGNSDKLEQGETVLAMGSPYGLSQTVTRGIVSAMGRANVGIVDYENFIQTDAAINPGNSGGALVNMRGQLIGINTAIFSRTGGSTGIGFAVPSNMARRVMAELIKRGKVTRGWLGVSIQDVTRDLAKQLRLKRASGALVNDVLAGTPAEKAGLQSGDVIVSFNGKRILNATVLRNVVAITPVGRTVEIKIIRNGRARTLRTKITEQPKRVARSPSRGDAVPTGTALVGVDVIKLTAQLARQLRLTAGTAGVVVADVEVGTPAEKAGLMAGDVILEINGRPVTSVNAFRSRAMRLKKGQGIMLRISRLGSKRFIPISP